MKNLAAIFLFGVALTAVCWSFGGARRGSGLVKAAAEATYEYRVATFNAPYKSYPPAKPYLDLDRLPGNFQAFLNGNMYSDGHANWELVSSPANFAIEHNIVIFRRLK